MANVIKHKRGSGSDPGASDLVVGELAIRTDTGKLFTKMDSGALAEIAGGGSDIAINTLSSSSGTGGGSATFNGSAYRFTLSSPPAVSAQQLLVSINGVIQKPVAGTGQPSEGFSVDGNDIILGDAPATGSDFFILTFRSLGVSVPADNSVTSAKIVDGTITGSDLATNVDLVDNQKLRFGTSSEKGEIYNDGNDLFINHTEAGYLQLQGNYGVLLQRHNGTENLLRAFSNGAVEIFYDNNKKFETTSSGVTVTGGLTTTGNIDAGTANFLTDDNGKFIAGTHEDLQIYHDGSHSYIDDTRTSGNLYIQSNHVNIDSKNGEQFINCIQDGAVELYHDNSKKFETTANGVTVETSNSSTTESNADTLIVRNTNNGASTYAGIRLEASSVSTTDFYISNKKHSAGNGCDLRIGQGTTERLKITESGQIQVPDNGKFVAGTGSDLQIYHDGTNSNIKNDTNQLNLLGNDIRLLNNGASKALIKAFDGGAAELYHNGSKRLESTTEGISISGSVTGNAIENATLRFNIINSSGDEKKAQIISTKVADISSTIEFGTTVSHAYAERMRIHSNGLVGIGTAAPVRRLHLHDDSSASNYLAVTNSTTGTSTSDGVLFGLNSGEQAIIWNFENTALKFATNGTERALIKNDGRVAINTDILANGADEYGGFVSMKPNHIFNNNAEDLATSATQSTLRVRTSSNSSMSLYIGGLDNSIDSARPYLQVGNLAGASGATAFYDLYLCPFGGIVRTKQIIPKEDDQHDLGSSANRWDDVFATNGTINTSDRNEKNTIVDSDLGLSFINKLKPVSYKFNGKTRTHYGLISQDVETVLSDISKSTTDFAGFIKSVVSDVLYTEDEPLPDDKKVGDVKTPGSTNYGLRYAEFIAPLIKAVQELSAKVEALEAK